jgi:hypothetical protein
MTNNLERAANNGFSRNSAKFLKNHIIDSFDCAMLRMTFLQNLVLYHVDYVHITCNSVIAHVPSAVNFNQSYYHVQVVGFYRGSVIVSRSVNEVAVVS